MAQHLWMLNSALVGVGVASLLLFQAASLELPAVPRLAPINAEEPTEQKPQDKVAQENLWAMIYQNDIFGTYSPSDVKPVKRSLITPVPEPTVPQIPPPPEPRKQALIAPLQLTLKGVILAGFEEQSVALFADETNKEAMYYLGDQIKDSQILKIAHNRVVLLRSNGQQDIYYVRKDDAQAMVPDVQRWALMVKKIDDNTIQVDPEAFAKEVQTLGSLLERLALVGLVFEDEKPLGVRLGTQDDTELGKALGLATGDIITAVDEQEVLTADGRIKAYTATIAKTLGSKVVLKIVRNNAPLTITYNLARIVPPKQYSGVPAAPGTVPPKENLKMNKQQEREQMMRRFNTAHQTPAHHEKTMMDIRRRIFENLQARLAGQAPPS